MMASFHVTPYLLDEPHEHTSSASCRLALLCSCFFVFEIAKLTGHVCDGC